MLEEATCSSLLLLLFIPLLLRLPHTILADNSTATIRIGSLLAANSTIGTVAQQAILLALHHINSDPSLLHSWKLELQSFDTNCSAFQAAAAAIELMEQEVVAIVGPQSSTSAHFIAQMANTVQVPLLSFSATDPALSEYQYPFFFRIAHSDAVQMKGVAALVSYYGWREIVAICTDDDFGTNGISALDDALVSVGARIVHKAALPPGIDTSEISNLLIKLTVIESRVFVVHMQQDIALTLFTTANNLELMTTGYAWIITDSMAATLDTSVLDTTAINSIQGIIGTHTFIPLSSQYQSFLNQWKKFQGQLVTSTQLHIYGLYAYDSMWVIAHALDSLLKNALNFTFEDKTGFPSYAGGNSELAKLKTFKEGPLLRQEILRTKLNGTSGPIQLDRKGDLMGSVFEIVNVVGKALHTVGYWSNQTGISSSLPGGLDGEPVSLPLTPPVAKKLNGVIWPGGSLQTPRGWVLTNNGRPLRIAVPHKVGYEQFVTIGNSSNSSEFQGFCIDVFLKALKSLPYGVTYKFFPYGSGSSTPIYDEIIQQLANQVFDAVVGDVTITTKRMQLVDFTQPYIESGLVVLVPVKKANNNSAWDFLRPFTLSMWCTTGAFFLFTGMVVWILEHKKNRHFRGRPKKQIVTILWFIFSTLFFAHREDTRSVLGRCALIIWLFVVLIITSSYTANLTSILTVQQLTPTIQGISTLQTSDVPIGYQTGSFAREYLISLNIAAERLKPLSTIDSYANALKLGPNGGGVSAIVDELPYVQVFLQTQSGFAIAGQEFTKAGWGFAFPKDSQLAIDLSTAILSISESGELQKIHDIWLTGGNYGNTDTQVQSDQLGLGSFWGLFLVTGVASVLCLFIYIGRLLWGFSRSSDASYLSEGGRSFSSRGAGFIKSFASYMDEHGNPKSRSRNREGKVTARSDQSPSGSLPDTSEEV